MNQRIDQRSLNELCMRSIPEEEDEERKGIEEEVKTDNHTMTRRIKSYYQPVRKVSIKKINDLN